MDQKRVIEIIFEESAKIPPRYEDYSEDLNSYIAEIVDLEKRHQSATRNIKIEIADQISRFGGDVMAKTDGIEK